MINTRRTTVLVSGTIALAVAATPLLAGAQDTGNKTFMVRDMAEDGQDLRSSPQSPASIYDLAELYLKTMLPGATQTGRNTWTWKGHSINVPSPEHFTDQDYSKVTRQVDFVANGVGRM